MSLEPTGNATSTKYTAGQIATKAVNDKGKEAAVTVTPESIGQKVDKAELNQSGDNAGGQGRQYGRHGSRRQGDPRGRSGHRTARAGQRARALMLDFLTECSKITTPTLMGTMPLSTCRTSRP